MTLVNPEHLDIVVVAHTRPKLLRDTLRMWHETTPYRTLYVIANHPDTLKDITLPPRAVPLQTARVPQHAGQLSASWNLAFQWTFFQSREVEWVILSQDDVRVATGWLERVNAHDFDVYNAPAGDMIMLIRRSAWVRVGWFDEHIRTIGGQDMDWLARAVIVLGPDRVSSEDYHGWSYNPIGLAEFWESSGGKATPGASYLSDPHVDTALKTALEVKWGLSSQALHDALVNHVLPSAPPVEYDWYPWITRI